MKSNPHQGMGADINQVAQGLPMDGLEHMISDSPIITATMAGIDLVFGVCSRALCGNRLHPQETGVEIVGVRQSEDCQKFGRTAEDGVSGSPTDTHQILEYFYQFLFTMSIFDNSNDPY